jgi:hypothetical protein
MSISRRGCGVMALVGVELVVRARAETKKRVVLIGAILDACATR